LKKSVESHLHGWFSSNLTVTTADAHEAFGVMPSTAKVYLSNLSKKGILKRLSPGVYGPGENWNAPSPITVSHKVAPKTASAGRPLSPEGLLLRERERLLALKAEAEGKATAYGFQIGKIDVALNALEGMGV
jgi:hypothetical protein